MSKRSMLNLIFYKVFGIRQGTSLWEWEIDCGNIEVVYSKDISVLKGGLWNLTTKWRQWCWCHFWKDGCNLA